MIVLIILDFVLLCKGAYSKSEHPSNKFEYLMEWKDNIAEEEAWNDAVHIDTINGYRHYLAEYCEQSTGNVHAAEATRRIAELVQEQKERVIKDLSADCNAYPLEYIKNICRIQRDDLIGILRDSKGRVCDEVLKSWDKRQYSWSSGEPIPIPKGRTEFYFWGICGSGKGSVMASVLNEANKMGILHSQYFPGYSYLHSFLELFTEDTKAPAVFFPPSTDNDLVQWLPFDLSKTVWSGLNCAFMEINYTVVETISNLAIGKPARYHGLLRTFNLTMDYLQNKDNPKYHFFLLDGNPISSEDEQHILYNTICYLNKNGVFDQNTLGASLVVTKCDRLSPNRDEWLNVANDFMMENFKDFVRLLKAIACEKFSNSRINVFPFSVGEQFLQQLCLYNPESAKVLLKEVLNVLSLNVETDSVANPILCI